MPDDPPDPDVIPLEPLEAPSPTRAAATRTSEAIATPATRTMELSRACRRCGYDLAGLGQAAKCPECGFPARGIGRHRESDQLAGAPTPWLRVLSTGATALMVGAFGGLGASIGLNMTGHWANLIVMVGGAGCWDVGVWLTTRPRPGPPKGGTREPGEWLWSRHIARWSQFAWIVAALSEAGTLYAPLAGISMTLGALALVIALSGLPAVMVHLSRLALWANDDDLAARFRSCSVLAPIGVVCAIGVARGLGFGTIWASWWPFRMMAIMVILALLLPLFFSLAQLWYARSMAAWAVVYNLRADDRIDRDRERAERHERVARADRLRAERDGS